MWWLLGIGYAISVALAFLFLLALESAGGATPSARDWPAIIGTAVFWPFVLARVFLGR